MPVPITTLRRPGARMKPIIRCGYNCGVVEFGRDEAKRDWVLAERGIDFLRFQLIRRASRSHGADAARQGRTLSEYWFD